MARPKSNRKALCHPELKHRAKGLCDRCYNRTQQPKHAECVRIRRKAELTQTQFARYADCHPDRKHYCKGFCVQCYNRFLKPKSKKKTKEQEYKTNLKVKYGLLPSDIEKLRHSQDNKCALCRKESNKLVIDHDHCTGRVRGLLCNGCNIALAGYEKLVTNYRLIRYLQYDDTHPRLCDLE